MSWDILVINFDGKPPSKLDDLPAHLEPRTMGDAAKVRDRISAALPGVHWSEPGWGLLESDAWSIEFNLQATGPVGNFMLHVRGGGDPLAAILTLCESTKWSAYDISGERFLELEAPTPDGWRAFQNYRDHIIGSSESE